MSYLEINDSNWQEQLGDGHTVNIGGIDRVVGGCRRVKYAYGKNPYAKPCEEVFDLIPESEWVDRIKERDENKSWQYEIAKQLKVKDQGRLGFCHAYGTVETAEVSRAIANEPYVQLSAESIGGPVTNWRNEGADPSDDLEQLINVGACRQDFMDKAWSLNPRKWKDGWEEDCANHKCTEWIDLAVPGKELEAAVSACLLGFACGLGYMWWFHFVMSGLKLKVVDASAKRMYNKYSMLGRNSWGPDYGEDGFFWLTGTKMIPDWSFAIKQMTPSL